MSRAIILIGCLTAAGAVAGYTRYFQEPAEPTPVFTVHVPQRPAEPPPPPVPVPATRPVVVPADRASLARALQRELTRVGCYSGEINGVWTTSSRMAMKSFTDKVNASLPIDNPDAVLLSLVQGQQGNVCGPACPPGQTASEGGRCELPAVLAKSAPDPVVPEAKTEPPTERSGVVPATAAAATALAATAAISKDAPRASAGDSPMRPAAAAPDDTSPKGGRAARHSGPTPAEGVYGRRHRRHSNRSRPPKIVRNILRAFGIR